MVTAGGPTAGTVSRRALLLGTAALLAGCTARPGHAARVAAATRTTTVSRSPAPAPAPTTVAPATVAPTTVAPATVAPTTVAPATDLAAVTSRATVPVLCWHQLRDWAAGDSSYDRTSLICPPAMFRGQLDALAGAGYTTITPDQYLAYLQTGVPLPDKPVLLTFDDSQGTQMTEALPQLQHRDMIATFFIMTVVLDKPNWMSRDNLVQLDAAGMTVAAHTWDHHRADRYTDPDWAVQLDQPKALLEGLLGKPVRHFAYPYGAWDADDFPHLTAAGYATAFQLSDDPVDPAAPLFTLRRILMNSNWTGPDLLTQLA